MKKWPNDNKYADFSAVIEPLKDAFKHYYKLTYKKPTKSFNTKEVYDAGKVALCTVPSPEELLEKKYMEWRISDKAEDHIDVFFGIAFRYGMEQGRRSVLGSSEVRHMDLLINNMTDKNALKIEDLQIFWKFFKEHSS